MSTEELLHPLVTGTAAFAETEDRFIDRGSTACTLGGSRHGDEAVGQLQEARHQEGNEGHGENRASSYEMAYLADRRDGRHEADDITADDQDDTRCQDGREAELRRTDRSLPLIRLDGTGLQVVLGRRNRIVDGGSELYAGDHGVGDEDELPAGEVRERHVHVNRHHDRNHRDDRHHDRVERDRDDDEDAYHREAVDEVIIRDQDGFHILGRRGVTGDVRLARVVALDDVGDLIRVLEGGRGFRFRSYIDEQSRIAVLMEKLGHRARKEALRKSLRKVSLHAGDILYIWKIFQFIAELLLLQPIGIREDRDEQIASTELLVDRRGVFIHRGSRSGTRRIRAVHELVHALCEVDRSGHHEGSHQDDRA